MRAAQLLEVLATADRPLGLSEIARRLGSPKSSALAICAALTHTDLIVRLEDGAYRLGPALLYLGHAYLNQTDIGAEFDRTCRELNPIPTETLVLAALDRTHVVYIAKRTGTVPVGISYEIGMRLPANCTASGKALLSGLPDDEVRDLYAGHDKLPRLTDRSIATLPKLLKELEKIRSTGSSIDDEETVKGMMCFATAVPGRLRRQASAVAVSLVKSTVDDEIRDRTVSSLLELAGALSLPGRTALNLEGVVSA